MKDISKLPMRQLTGITAQNACRSFSKLPMRQLTYHLSDNAREHISKLPMRQLTGSCILALRFARF